MTETIAWVGLIATLALLGVTFWYAKTTKEMAETAKEAAEASARATEAAERSADAARDAATVAQSQIKPEFTGRTVASYAGDHDWASAIVLQSVGDAVVVQKVRVRRAFRESTKDQLDGQPALADAELVTWGPDSTLPRRLHYGETLTLTHPALDENELDPFYRFILDVEYTFSEEGGTGGSKILIFNRS